MTELNIEEAKNSATLRGLGERIKNLRIERGLTLSVLSGKSQISVAMISHIERGKTTPSLKLLDRLRVALGVPLASFFDVSSDSVGEEGVIARAGKRSVLTFDSGLMKELLSPLWHAEMELLLLTIEVNGNSGPDPWRRVGEKGGMVLQGRIELQIGEQAYILDEGDSFQFDSGQPHAFRNLSKTTAKVIWVILSKEAG